MPSPSEHDSEHKEEIVQLPAALRRPRSKVATTETHDPDGFAFGCAGGAIVLITLGILGMVMQTVSFGPRGGKATTITGQGAVWLGALMAGLGVVVLVATVLVATVWWTRARRHTGPPPHRTNTLRQQAEEFPTYSPSRSL